MSKPRKKIVAARMSLLTRIRKNKIKHTGDSKNNKAVRWFVLLSGWIASLFLGLLDLPEKLVSFSKNSSEAVDVAYAVVFDYKTYQGNFSSDPDAWVGRNLIDDELPDKDYGDIQISISYIKNGEFQGEIYSKAFERNPEVQWTRIFLSGRFGALGGLYLDAWDIKNNQQSIVSRYKLEVENKKLGTLLLKSIDGEEGQVTLWPTNREMVDGDFSQIYKKIFSEFAEEKAKSRRPISELRSIDERLNRKSIDSGN